MSEEPLIPGESLEGFISFISDALSILEAERNYFPLLCLLVYQYDALCSLYASGHMEAALDVFESIAETREALTHSHWLSRKELLRSREASKAAKAKHKETNAYRAAAIAQWNAGGHPFSSMRAFARHMYKDFGVTDYMTVYNWLRQARLESEGDQD